VDPGLSFVQPRPVFSQQTLLKKYPAPPHPLLEIRELINQTLLEKF
jgi:hypothetical protein